jgi:ABC-type multidrug transport system ATPase subunit
MTTAGIDIERSTRGSARQPMSRALSLSVALGETLAVLGANTAGTSTAADGVSTSRRHDGGHFRAHGLDPIEHRTPERHLVIFPARVL